VDWIHIRKYVPQPTAPPCAPPLWRCISVKSKKLFQSTGNGMFRRNQRALNLPVGIPVTWHKR
jgi:hypothetical protein